MTEETAVKTEPEEQPIVDGAEEQQASDQPPEIVLEGETDETPKSDAVPLAKHLKLRDRLRAEKQEAEQSGEALRRENELLRARLDSMKQPKEEGPPKAEQFDYDDDKHQAALAEWYRQQATAAAQEEARKFQQQSQQSATAQQFESRLDKALEEHQSQADELQIADYGDAFSAVSQSIGQDGFRHLVAEGVVDAKTVNFLAKNPDRLASVAAMFQSGNYVGGIARLAELKSKTVVRQSRQVPDPDIPLEGGGAGGNSYQSRLDKLRAQADKSGVLPSAEIAKLKREAREKGFAVT